MKIVDVGLCLSSSLAYHHRLAGLVQVALDEAPSRAPMIFGSCNAAAYDMEATTWSTAFTSLGDRPIASAACASGLHALWLAATRLAYDLEEVIVVAADILSPASHANFEALRVLDDEPAPWQPTSRGFQEGEAGVVLRLRRGSGVVGPVLGQDLAALVKLVGGDVSFAIGQGTGPVAIDEQELAALPPNTPVTTALVKCGHTIGASGLLSVALGALVRGELDPTGRDALNATYERALHLLSIPPAIAIDGRPIGLPSNLRGDVLVTCRALGGACAVVRLGDGEIRQQSRWVEPQKPPPLRLPLLRQIAALPRPERLPDVILVRLDAPLVPPDDARIGTRLLPSVVLEITPGFLSQLLARTWGFEGPALTLVGGSDTEWVPTLAAIRHVHGEVLVLHVHERDFEWGT